MTSDTRDRAIDLAIAASLALFPLLPTGPTYLGLDWPWALDVFFLVFLVGGLLILLTDRIGSPTVVSAHASDSVRLVRRGYVLWLIPVGAATFLGLLERAPFDATLWWVEADGLAGRLGRPMDQVADPFYPLRVGLTCLEGALMFWLVSALMRRTPQPGRRARTAVHGCLWGVALVSLIAVVQYVTGTNLHEYWVRANPHLTRSHATLDDPNALASYLVLGIGLAMGVAWSGTIGRRPVSAALVAGLALLALVTTVSRAGWAGLMLAGLVCAALLPEVLVEQGSAARALRRVARGLAMVLILAVLAWTVAAITLPKRTTSVVPSTPWQAALQTVDPRESIETILKGRHLFWLAALDLAGDHRVLGAGLGAFPRFLAGYPGSGGAENAHNYFLQILAEAGIVGLAALIVLLTTIAWALRWPARRLGRGHAKFAVGLSMGMLAFVLTWLTGHPLLNVSNQLWLAGVLAVGLAALEPIGRAEPAIVAVHPPDPGRRWLLHPAWVPAVAAVTIAAAVPRAMGAARGGDPAVSRAAGVYGWETAPASEDAPPDPRFRWTRARAALREPVHGMVLTVPVYLARPDVPAQPVAVHVNVGGVPADPVTFVKNGWHGLSYDLAVLHGESQWRSLRTITLEFRIVPPVVPARAGASDDTRELGIGLGDVQWSGAAGGPATATP
jgi:O-antigen ligase